MRSTFLALACGVFWALAPNGWSAPCSYTLAPTSASLSAAAGSNSFAITAGASCAWNATSTNSWIHTSSAGSGNGTIGYTFDANSDPLPRSGAISVGGKVFSVSQAGAPLSLNTALDNDLTWVTSSPYPWSGTNVPTFDGVDAAVCGNTAVHNSESWLETTVQGPGELTFWWKVVSDPLDALQFYVDGGMQEEILGVVDWTYRSYSIGPGTHTLRWTYYKDDGFNAFPDKGWLDRVSYTTNAPISLPTSLDTCGVAWTSGGNTNTTYWTGQSNVTHDGISAAQSGALHTSQQSWLQAQVSGVTNVSFWWKVSAQANYDFFEFFTNGVLAKRITGEVDWQSNYFRLPATTNLLTWRFIRTNFVIISPGQMAAWVDQVAFSRPDPTPPVVLYAFTNLLLAASSNCAAALPDLTTTNYFLAEDACSSVTVTQSPVAGTLLARGTNQVILVAQDAAGNSVASTNTVVVADLSPPLLSLLGPNPLTLECASTYAEPGITVEDNCSGSITLSTNGTVGAAVGSYTIVYIATDASGNSATNTRTVDVVDTIAPMVTLNGPATVMVECHSAFVDLGATAVDACVGPLTVQVSGAVNTNATGTNLLTYQAHDGRGNTNQVTRTVIVQDTTPPAVLFAFANLALNANTNCQATLPDLTSSNYFAAADLCGSVNVTQDPAPGSLLGLGTNQVVLTAQDSAGNAVSSTNLVVVSDVAAPSLTAPANVLVQTAPGTCYATNVALGEPSVSDNCTLSGVTNDAPASFSLGTNVVTWTAIDAQGNSTNAMQWVIVSDVEPPAIGCPTSITLTAEPGQSLAAVNLGTPVISDNCSVNSVTNNAPEQFPLGTNLVTWTVTDNSGNQNSCMQEIVINPAPDLPHQITALVPNVDGTMTVHFQGTPQVNYAVQISSNLVDWISVQTNTASENGTWNYHDLTTTNAALRFYRAARN